MHTKMHMMSHIKVRSSTTYNILLAEFEELPRKITRSQAYYGLSTMAPPSIHISASHKATSPSQHT